MKKKYNCSFFNLKLFLLIFFVYTNSYGLTIYVNDAFTPDDVYTTAAGNNANNGLTPATPKATLAGALAIATNGDIIYIDYGNYNDVGLNINVEVEIIGAGEEMTVFRRTSGINRWGVISANNVKVSKLTITEYNLASDGIAVAISSGSGIEFNRVTIYANVGSAGQGAVWITGATTSATFKNSGSPCNRVGAANYGGAFKIEDATAVIDNCSINNNIISALYGGGVLVAGNNSNVTIINTTFDDNEASSGGALAVTGSNATVNVSGSCFNNNRATIAVSNEGGGAVFLRPSTNSSTSTINFSNCSFNGNTSIGASSDGGAVCITNLNSPNINVNFTTCSFSGNSTNDDGDDIYFRKALAAIYNITFRNNSFFDVFAGSKVNLYNNNLLASEIKFEGLTTPTGTSTMTYSPIGRLMQKTAVGQNTNMISTYAYDAKGLLKQAIRYEEDPVIFMESEVMYGDKSDVPDEEYYIPLGKADVKKVGRDITIVSYNKMMKVALGAAAELEKEGISAEVVDLRTIRPLDWMTVLESVKKTNRLVIIEEQWPFASVSSELSYRIQKEGFDYLDAPIRRITSADAPMHYAPNLTALAIPDITRTVKLVKEVMYLNK